MADICVLASGGLDSAVLLAEMARSGDRVVPLYVTCGLYWEAVEQYWLELFLEALDRSSIQPLQTLDLNVRDLYGSHWSTTGREVPGDTSADEAVYLPGRNLLLLAKTAVFCTLNGIGSVAVGTLRGNPFPDATPAFFRAFEEAVATGLAHPFTILTPFRELSKAEVIARGKDLPLQLTFSCIAPAGSDHCGRCNKCAERRKAFRDASLPDPTPYRDNRL